MQPFASSLAVVQPLFAEEFNRAAFGERFLNTFCVSLVYVMFGLLLFALTFWVITKVVPFSMRKEIEEDQNTSLAILIGSVFLGIAIIIAAAIHGS